MRQITAGRRPVYAHVNRTQAARRALAVIYVPDGETFRERRHVVTQDVGFAAGQPIRGSRFPILVKAWFGGIPDGCLLQDKYCSIIGDIVCVARTVNIVHWLQEEK